MSENSLKQLVKKALLNYDIKNEKHEDIINTKEYIFNTENATLTFNKLNKKFKFNILGIFDYSKKIWIWSWLVPSYSYNHILYTKKLLDYGIKINPEKIDIEFLWIKTQLVNSRFLLDDSLQLDIHLAVISYLMKDNFDFIYPVTKQMTKNKDDKLIIYYILKEI
jgi:hypothetical protein